MTSVMAQTTLPLPSYTLNLLSLLTDQDPAVLRTAVDRLLEISDHAWPQMASALPALSALAENLKFPGFQFQNDAPDICRYF